MPPISSFISEDIRILGLCTLLSGCVVRTAAAPSQSLRSFPGFPGPRSRDSLSAPSMPHAPALGGWVLRRHIWMCITTAITRALSSRLQCHFCTCASSAESFTPTADWVFHSLFSWPCHWPLCQRFGSPSLPPVGNLLAPFSIKRPLGFPFQPGCFFGFVGLCRVLDGPTPAWLRSHLAFCSVGPLRF
jgi:hypothetical protein